MNKLLLWSTFIAFTTISTAEAGMLGGGSSSRSNPSTTNESGPLQNTSTRNFPLPNLPKNMPSSRQEATSGGSLNASTLENYGISAEEADAFLAKTKDMSPDELQSYLRSLKAGLDSGKIKPSQLDDSLPDDFDPYPRPKRKPKTLEQQKNEDAFESLLSDVLPLSPEQIQRLQKYYDIGLKAQATPPNPPPNPNFISLPVNLEPGSQAPVIRLEAGFVSTMLFVDRRGKPWAIESYSLGDAQNFNIQWDNQSNTMYVQSLKKYLHANMAIKLACLDTPVMLTLVSGQKEVDFRVDLQVQDLGPESKNGCGADGKMIEGDSIFEEASYSAQVNNDMINMLDGVPPQGSIKLTVHGAPGQAWLYKNKVYYRGSVTLLSPAWLAKVTSPDGTHVYEMMQTPYLLASKDGKTIHIKLTGL